MNANMTNPRRLNANIVTPLWFQVVVVGHRKWFRRRARLFRRPLQE